MEIAGQRRSTRGGKIALLVVLAIAIGILAYSLDRSKRYPSTDDATIDAEVVHVAAAVGGRIIHIPVRENARVRKGDLLFQIDPFPYRAALAQAEANLALARAGLGTQTRVVATQRSGAIIAADQIRRAAANQALAARTVERLRPLTAQGYVPRQQLDQAEVALRDATTSLIQAREQQSAARTAVDTVAGATAAVQAGEAAVALARRALEDTSVRAPHAGRVVGLAVLSGELVVPSQSLFTLVADDEWHAVGNFREGALRHIAIGDCATVYSLIDRSHPIRGTIDGIGSAVLDTDRVNVPRSVPYVEKSLNWVRVAQRFPVRVRLSGPPEQIVRSGASAVIQVRHGNACR
ncbi:multidrug transporter subunit MdtN [Edaphosphingomonas haloaromaticamans]|uniref:Multidrug resistance protein MdtN n=1 Tax=Edaphosphingomonas haloaromaticamans TaxID=653954 RepID=A0A1S1HKG6_9SPHN|nr:multidrug transporter subunit MdtN [Sphingomonas haloaromaticamans]OHT22312.1 Multidrug resistance protein MdtN [Sphingomonas haloaromaticamans]